VQLLHLLTIHVGVVIRHLQQHTQKAVNGR
jgi:hypothetical protein